MNHVLAVATPTLETADFTAISEQIVAELGVALPAGLGVLAIVAGVYFGIRLFRRIARV